MNSLRSGPGAVRRDDEGVAGFFEDLPVLMLVLAGVTVLVASSACVSHQNAAAEAEMNLDETAQDMIQSLLRTIRTQIGPEPRIPSLEGTGLQSAVADFSEGRSFSLTIAGVYPVKHLVVAVTVGDPGSACSTGFACAQFIALDDQGFSVILEARVIVW